MIDEIEKNIIAGAVRVLRRRAVRQRERATDWTVIGANSLRITSGEGAIALRIAEALEDAANGIEDGGAS